MLNCVPIYKVFSRANDGVRLQPKTEKLRSAAAIHLAGLAQTGLRAVSRAETKFGKKNRRSVV